jgi:hypothetical protein
MEKDEKGGVFGAHWGDDKCVQNFWLENLKGTDHSEALGKDGRIIQ